MDLWDYFNFDSAFAYCSKGADRIRTIDVLIVYICLQLCPQAEALLKIKVLPGAEETN
jgi:hypothetical protein